MSVDTWMAFLEERGVTPSRHSVVTSTEPQFADGPDYVEFTRSSMPMVGLGRS